MRDNQTTVERLACLKVGDAVEYDKEVRQGGFDWHPYPATVLKVGLRRVKLAFDGREAWVTPNRVRKGTFNA